MNMGWIHIFTVGTSVALNLANDRAKNCFNPQFKDIVERAKRIPPGSEEERAAEAELRKFLNNAVAVISQNPGECSAELNAYLGLIREYEQYRAEKIYLLATDTGLGRFSAEVLQSVITQHLGITCDLRVVGRWGWGPEFFDDALADLMDKMSSIVKTEKARGSRIAMNLTGGFKPETTFAYLLASLYDVDVVYYRHGSFGRSVVLPVLPVEPRRDLVEQVLRLFSGRHVVPISELPSDERLVLLLRERGESGGYTLRPWVKRLVEEAH